MFVDVMTCQYSAAGQGAQVTKSRLYFFIDDATIRTLNLPSGDDILEITN
jgi:hypothetical protein